MAMLTSKPFLTAAIVLGAGLLAVAHTPVKRPRHNTISPSAPNPFAALKRAETIVFKGCAVTFKYVLATGAVESAVLDPSESDHHANCSDLVVSSADKLSLSLDGVGDLGIAKFGEGYISSGSDSCTTRVILGTLYTWGSPCPN